MTMGNRTARLLLLTVTALAIALVAASAAAAGGRTYNTKIPGFRSPSSVAFNADETLWVSDGGHETAEGQPGHDNPGQNGIYKYAAFPSLELLLTPNTLSTWSFFSLALQLSVDHATGEVFVSMSNGRTLDIFNEKGEHLRAWSAINGAAGGGAAQGGIHVAIDNSDTVSKGRVYLSLSEPENDVEALDAQQRPVDFPATASYLSNNRVTGTPSGPFGEVGNVTVDQDGNLYVTDAEENVVDEFDSTGTFQRAFPAPRAEAGTTAPGGVGVDPTNGNVLVVEGFYNEETGEGGIAEYDSSGNLLARLTHKDPVEFGFQPGGTPAVNSDGYFYVPNGESVSVFNPAPAMPAVAYKPVSGTTTTAGTLNATIDPNGGGDVTDCHFEYGASASYGLGSLPCAPDPAASPPGTNFSAPTDVSAAVSSLTVESTYHYRVVVENASGVKYGADQTYTPHRVVGLRTDPASDLTESGATLNGSLLGDGTPTHYFFEWGKTSAYGNVSAALPGTDAGSPSGPGPTALPFVLGGLAPYTTYHYRVVASAGANTSFGDDRYFTTPPGVPSIGPESVTAVHSDRAVMHAEVNANGADTGVHFEYVPDADFQKSGFANATQSPESAIGIGMGKHLQPTSVSLATLTPGTLYHYRAVGENDAGTGVPSVDRTFKTFPYGFNDTCANAHVRQQTGSALLLDCRAYELASAANAGGYDVESDLVSGQTPFGGYPEAQGPSRILYGVHNGGVPGTGVPTNHGVDPYVATRGADGWTTKYVGIPADNPNASAPFASTVEEADPGLDALAFGGPEICSPCFSDGSAGEPVRLPGGEIVQGMTGSIPQPAAVPAGFIGRHLSADGTHFVFGSTSKFEADGNSNGDVSIYDRNLATGITHVVSKTPGGTTMTGAGIGELDVSADGSRILIGQLVSTDSAGNRYWHLYMNVGDAAQTIDLMPGSIGGALYDGMSADGSRVYLTSADKLSGDDGDTSADIYRSDVSGSAAVLTRVSTGSGSIGNTDSCDPAANTIHAHWNTVGATANCDAVAVGGRGGVSSGDGSIYFLSPELLDASGAGGEPVEGAPNLYAARPGSGPEYIRTLESSANAPLPPAAHPFKRGVGSFANPAGVAIDHDTGDFYVFDIGTDNGVGNIQKFDSSGRPVLDFAANGKLGVSGVLGFYNVPDTIAVDNSPSVNHGNLFVPDLQDGIVKMFDSSGAHISDITEQPAPTAVAVNPSNGNIYITGLGGSVNVFTPAGVQITSFPTLGGETGIAVDSSGRVYVTSGGGFSAAKGTTEIYSSSGTDLGQLTGDPSYGVAVDPSDDHVYVDEGDRLVEFDATGKVFGNPIATGRITGSIGMAADSGSLAVTNHAAGNVLTFGPLAVPIDPATDSPLVIDSVSEAGTRHTADFQVSPSGDDAVFTSTQSQTGYENVGHREVYRYDSPSDTVICASCNPTEEQATGESTLASNGLSLSDDGRVFFNSTEGLVDRDLNDRQDAYEWESGKGIELISTGTGPLPSSLLSVSADGVDAYFFTRDTLVVGDDNGGRVKVYDARTQGGFPFIPDQVPCKASDECHGPGSQAAPAPQVGTIAGTPLGNSEPSAGKCKREGKCKHHRKRRHHKSKRHRKTHQGGKK